ncbi:MAG: potassium channel protein [Desulfovibrionales bacterium]|jgi:Trk K+ transport system NAD-binding subunit|nr:potassium channel protein [Desulfovibrionales bacterium]
MKFLISQLTALINISKQNTNSRLLLRFLSILGFLFALYSVLFHFLMQYEGQEHSWVTGMYWTLTVMTTLGFGDITFASDPGRLFSMLVMVSGVIFLLIMLPFTFIQFFYAPWLEAQNKARAPRCVPETISGHVILTHFDAVTVNLVEKLNQYNIPYVILIADLQEALNLYESGFRVVVGELDDPETYKRLRVQHAALVVVMNDDVSSTNIIFTIREVADQVHTVTNADQDDSLDILRLAGSTHTFQFTTMLGQVLARRVLGLSMQANIIGRFNELIIAEAPAMRTPLQGRTLAESKLRELTGVNVVGVWEQGRFQLPGPNTLIGMSTVLVLAGSADQLAQYDTHMQPSGLDKEHMGPVLVLGGGRVGMAVAQTLGGRGIDYRVVEKRTLKTQNDERIILGSATDLDILMKAGITDTPSIIITTHDDDLNIFLTIYCRRLRPDVQIISRASLDRNINTLHRAGANLVMSFASLCTTTIMNLLKPEKILMLSEGLNIFRAHANQAIIGKALMDQNIREDTGCSIIAIKRDDHVSINPLPSTILNADDELILIGTAEAEKKFTKKYQRS